MIPEYTPDVGDREGDAVRDVLESGWISPKGEAVTQFEDAMTSYLDIEHGLGVDSGTAALHLALEAAGIGPGDTVIVQDFTYASTALAVTYTGAEIIFVDIERETLGPDPEHVETVAGDADALIIGHMFGIPAQLDRLIEIADRHDLTVVEDGCHCLGATYRGKKIGTVGDIGCFSFSWCKQITTGKGGFLATDNESYMKNAQQLGNYGRKPGDRYTFTQKGFNYRIDSIRAAIGTAQLQKITEIREKKEHLFDRYRELLTPNDLWTIPVERRDYVTTTPYLFYLRTSKRQKIEKQLSTHEIGYRTAYNPLHTQKAFKEAKKPFSYPNARDTATTMLSLPSHPSLTEQDVDHICQVLNTTS